MINLIQEQRLQTLNNERKARTAFFTLVGSVVVTGLGYGYINFQLDQMKGEQAKLKADLVRVAPTLAAIDGNKKEVDKLSPRLKVLEDAQKASDRWTRILTHLTTQTPQGTWLTGLRSAWTDSEKPIVITMNGIAQAQQPVGEFIMRVQNQPDLENVALHFTQEKQSSFARSVDFEVVAEIAGTAQPKIKPKENKS